MTQEEHVVSHDTQEVEERFIKKEYMHWVHRVAEVQALQPNEQDRHWRVDVRK